MHCLGAGVGGQGSPSGLGSLGGAIGVIRALGVLVCEGRIQGPPRGYKEGPHCAAPLETRPNNHVCERENYLCERYQTLINEIEDRTVIGSFLCVEVLLCSDCPCGLLKTTCKDPLFLVSSKSPWQSSSEILLEYWCIGNISSKHPETMNSQGLYQAVRSRLHFSQVAAWWSRSNGANPVYVATRVVPYNDDHLRKFRETPVEHTFPLAGSGDGNSIKVTVWALPRMENIPVMSCSLHPIKEDEDSVARALTPTKIIPISSISQTPDIFALPALLDDRLQTPCDKSGKHDCRYEEEDGSLPSPSIRSASERKRRRSLPCGPSETCMSIHPSPLTPVQEDTTRELRDQHSKYYYIGINSILEPPQVVQIEENSLKNNSTPSFDHLEHSFKTFSVKDQDENVEKKYKSTFDNPDQLNVKTFSRPPGTSRKNETSQGASIGFLEEDESPVAHMPVKSWLLGAFNELQGPCSAKNTNIFAKVHGKNGILNSNWANKMVPPISDETNLLICPFQERILFYDSNPGPWAYVYNAHSYQVPYHMAPSTCRFHQTHNKINHFNTTVTKPLINFDSVANLETTKSPVAKEYTHLMSKLSFPEVRNNCNKNGIFDWMTKVPGRVLGVVPSSTSCKENSKVSTIQNPRANDVKVKSCNLKLSQWEFDEVMAVLRARTPSERRRAPVKNLKKRERNEKLEKQNSKFNTEGSDVGFVYEFHDVYSPEDCACISCNKFSQTKKKIFGYKEKHVCPKLKKSEDQSKPDYVESVSNKADVLLGAILRTSKDRRGLVDISNESRSRTMLSDENEKSKEPKDTLEQEKSLHSALNKRLIQFRQLFKREEKPDILTLEDHSKESLNAVPAKKQQKGKTRINFLNKDESLQDFVVYSETSLTSAYTDSKFHSTNFKEEFQVYDRVFSDVIIHQKVKAGERSTKPNEILKSKYNAGDDFVRYGIQQNEAVVFTSEENSDIMSSKLRCNQRHFVEEDETLEKIVPSALEQERFRRSLENAASMVFHSRTGLPLTSSPAPLRKGSCCFDFDSSLNSVSSKRSAIFELNTPPSPGAVSLEETDRETENTCDGEEVVRRRSNSRNRPQSHALLGSFEESALNGRLEPVSTVHGFTAELGASGSFCPKHQKLPVTVFFYTLGDNDKVSTPYLAHINLGKKGYQVPRSGTVQVTLLNPLGTVVKMFVVLYDLSDMPTRSHTFLRQRTLRDKTLRYLIHLRFMSGKSGRIYLHTDIRMIICRKSDVDTASDLGSAPPQEVRSYNYGPTHPKFSPRC
ncbi:protein FAM214A isoform X2 [Belonocnema kinseyi]|nr:protein FAM214A isoform X2 [Belonocnema kinseyi]